VTLHAEAAAQLEGRDTAGAHDIALEVYRHIVVTNTADAGPGSLREAIAEANAQCAQPCRMRFDIPAPAEIVPATPLPPIRADRIVIDATTAPAPVVIDGRAAGEGLEVHARCDAVVRGLTLRNFSASQGLWYTWERGCNRREHDQFLVERNTLESNLRGLRLDGAPRPLVKDNVIRNNRYSGIWMWAGSAWLLENRIENNGASGIFLGADVFTAEVLRNTISGHPHMGVAVAHGARDVEIHGNTMRDNRGLGIDWGLDGRSPARDDDAEGHGNAPVILSAKYDPGTQTTAVTFTLTTRKLAQVAGVDVEFFANATPHGEGDEPLAIAYLVRNDGVPVTVTLHRDLRGKWLNATASRWIDFSELGGTSEFSNSVRVVE
ncbi:MAG TPA: right-handed parallel beta-helix repeat-containing protein, partial [Thermoanaerobaculia bacterium]|nr:right-handed parallel beta-helix repeat-containing protein [Thermoanaerobaculia bacterium]